MTDLLLEEDEHRLDLVLEGGDLALDPGLGTPVLASLFTDALALAEDDLPGGDEDRRGWWAEALLTGEAAEVWGSRLWLLERAKLTTQRLGDAEVYTREGLRWLVEREIAERVDVVASRLDRTTLFLEVSIVRGAARQRGEVWEGTLELDIPVGPARLSVLAVP
jgi:phage gp46-like protein